MNNGGWKKEARSFKDFSHEKVFGAPPNDFVIRPFSRDTSGIPIVFQGSTFNCVPCTITWIQQFKEKMAGRSKALEQEFLAAVSNTASDGATPSQVLDAAKKIGICESEKWLAANKKLSVDLELAAKQHAIGGYAYLQSLSPVSIAHAIALDVIMVGVDSYQGSEPHMMAGVGIEERNGVMGVKTKNWWQKDVQDEGWVAFSDIKFAASILDEKPLGDVSLSAIHVLGSKWSFLSAFKKVLIKVIALVIASMGVVTSQPAQPVAQNYGAAGIYDQWSSTISGSGMTATDTSIPVSSLSVGNTGVSIVSASTTFPVYLTVNPNSTADRELIECNGISGLNFTNCYRQIAPTCNNATTTIQVLTGTSGAFPHPAGEPIIMSNNACFFNRFVDKNTRQVDIAGLKGFTNSSTYIGGNTTSSNAFLGFLVGNGSNVGFKFVGPVAGNTTATAYFNVGNGDLQLNASGTTVGASSTGAIVLTNGVFGVSVSGTSPIHIDSDNRLYVAVSSTASQNGGLIDIFQDAADGIYKLAWKTATFLSTAWTITGNWIFQGNVTSTGTFRVPTPTSTQDVANKGYVDSNISYNTATGTAGMTISAGQTIFVSPTGTLFLTNAAVTGTTYGFVGIAQSGATVGQQVSYVKPGGIADFMTGLIPGKQYFIADSAGNVGVAPGTIPARIGVALSSSRLLLNSPSYRARKSGTTTGFNGAEADTLVTGFIPTSVYLECAPNQDSQSIGWWKVDSLGTSSTLAIGGDDDAVPYLKSPTATGVSCKWEEGTTDFIAWITTTTNGFVVHSDGGASRTYYWVAEYDPDITAY